MKDAEMVENLKSAIEDLRGLMLPYPAIYAAKLKMTWVLEALEANPPLAEVGGRLIEQATIWVLLPIGLEHSDFTTLPDGNCDVTVTIRKRDV